MRTPLLASFLCCILFCTACKRNRTEVLATYSVLVQQLEWKDGSFENWKYDANDNIENTTGAGPASSAIERDFLYNGDQLALMQKTSLKEDTFYYDANRRIVRIEEGIMGMREQGRFRLDFTYDGQGKVIQMDFGHYKPGVYTLMTKSIYTWSADGLLLQIKTTAPGKPDEIIYDLTPENRSFIFNEWAFVNRYHLVFDQYEIWNIPVLKSMDRLPKRVVRTHKVGGQVSDQTTQEYSHNVDAIGRLLRRGMPNGDWMKITYQPTR
ncbi:hypothetical protein ACQKLP_12695 [Chitinophaga sp. NPDC101104]|uniref:hypothetical protein n=1 Tax=Chitinophaga sp. NPDC101104 TaxID=3390561 RepID=UPI003D0562A6